MTATAKKDDDQRMFDNGRAWAKEMAELLARLEAARDPAADCALIEVATLDSEDAAQFEKPWILQHENGDIEEYDTEDEAAAAQREWRKEWHLDPMTGEPESEDDVQREIDEGPLSIQVRDGWRSPGAPSDGAEEFEILLSTGGPALRIFGELSGGYAQSAELQAQDWFKPWTAVPDVDDDVVLRYAQCFYLGE